MREGLVTGAKGDRSGWVNGDWCMFAQEVSVVLDRKQLCAKGR